MVNFNDMKENFLGKPNTRKVWIYPNQILDRVEYFQTKY